MKTVAAILAGGSGKRFGGDIPKQFVKVRGRAVIEYTIEAFEKSRCIDEICVVVNSSCMDLMKEIAVKNSFKKLCAILPGGKERYDSSLAAVNYFKGRDINILIHDAARPKVDEEIISKAAKLLEDYEAVCTAVPATDTIAVSDESGILIENIPERSLMYQVQTPQGFHLKTIAAAYERALKDPNFFATDDCGVVKKYLPDVKICIVPGSRDNIKITHMEDLKLL